jgi:homoserine O-acetyltransferase
MAAPSVALLALVLSLTACATASPPVRPVASAANTAPSLENPLDGVLIRTFSSSNFMLDSGVVLPEIDIVYETYGRLAPGGRNAILITHAFTSSQHATGKYSPTDRAPGWWDGLIGPGKAFDTERYFIVSSNILGSSYGSTAPRSINPKTGKPYGPDFPTITLRDIVRAQRLLLSGLGVSHLIAVAGPSDGGFQAFQWAVTYPDFVDGIVAVESGPKARADMEPLSAMVTRLPADPNWNNGWYYDRGGVPTTMATVRYEALMRYGANELLAIAVPDPKQRQARIRRMAEIWAKEFDANSLVTLQKALAAYDTTGELKKIRAKVLYGLSRTDTLFPPSIAPGVLDSLEKAGVDVTYFEISSNFGHLASGAEWPQWAPTLELFLMKLQQ